MRNLEDLSVRPTWYNVQSGVVDLLRHRLRHLDRINRILLADDQQRRDDDGAEQLGEVRTSAQCLRATEQTCFRGRLDDLRDISNLRLVLCAGLTGQQGVTSDRCKISAGVKLTAVMSVYRAACPSRPGDGNSARWTR